VLAGEIPERCFDRDERPEARGDLVQGQKNRDVSRPARELRAAERFARGRVLDCFTSTGGFALHAARRAESVEAIDFFGSRSRDGGIERRANGLANIQFRKADVFEFLSGIERRYSMVILDPPAFAKSRKSIDDAARGYKEINLRALRLLEPGGVLVTCSCSHHMSEAMLFQIVAEAALDAGKTLRVLERRTQAADHPILLTVPETHYLKCLILEAL
jgi:23S rRNA (cytosine1962-C5)-methyltransferase